jgi:hypothetical protein
MGKKANNFDDFFVLNEKFLYELPSYRFNLDFLRRFRDYKNQTLFSYI